ncbi:MAG: adenylate/guanylate cyclase domain-containing protein [Treponema sp.]|nr:adenylate/guanylate cyclase domain-containing protein [Treponema sp.]
MAQKKPRKLRAALSITVSVFVGLSVSAAGGLFEYLEYKTYDLLVGLLAASTGPSDALVLVVLDQDSIDWAQEYRGWSWPWPRQAYGDLLEYMHTAGAASVAFDVLFSEPSVYGPEDDEAFIRASADFGRTVQAVFFSTQTGKAVSWPADTDFPLFQIEAPPVDTFKRLLPGFELLPGASGVIGAQFPIDGIRNAAGGIGNIMGKADADGIFRRATLFTFFDAKAVPGLSAASLLAAGAPEGIRYNEKKRLITWGDYTVPVDTKGRTLLRFRGDLDRYIPYSAAAVLQSAEAYRNGAEPLLGPENFAGKYLLFGYYAPGLFDICSTPISSVYPGVGMHITMLDNLLQGDFIRESPLWVGCCLNLGGIILMSLLALYAGPIPLVVSGGLGILVVICGLAGFAYYALDLWIPVVAPVTGMGITFLTAILYNYATEGSQKRFIKSAFSQYLSPAVIEQLLANPERLSLGGERREISIFFSDIQGFTAISETLDPAKLTELLNEYLSLMTDTILDSGGTIDKYEGDAIIAFWNAPVPYKDHPARALEASMACQQRLTEQQDFFYRKYGCSLLTRIGLNTGYAVVGNMGSSKRFDYTMLGDAVNLAARLEGLNKQFGTYLMCTEATFTHAGKTGSFWGRKLAQVVVIGRKEAVTVYEPMPHRVFAEAQGMLRRFDTARDLFYQGRFAEALPLFQALASEDKPSFYYAEQCAYYQKHPAAWKGVWQASTK